VYAYGALSLFPSIVVDIFNIFIEFELVKSFKDDEIVPTRMYKKWENPLYIKMLYVGVKILSLNNQIDLGSSGLLLLNGVHRILSDYFLN